MQKRFKLRILCCGGRGGGGGGADSSYAGLVDDDNEGRLQGTRLYLSICTAVGLPHIHTHTHTHTHFVAITFVVYHILILSAATIRSLAFFLFLPHPPGLPRCVP